jgi:cytochrome P450
MRCSTAEQHRSNSGCPVAHKYKLGTFNRPYSAVERWAHLNVMMAVLPSRSTLLEASSTAGGGCHVPESGADDQELPGGRKHQRLHPESPIYSVAEYLEIHGDSSVASSSASAFPIRNSRASGTVPVGPLPDCFSLIRPAAPIQWATAQNGTGFWLVNDYKISRKLLADPRLSRSAAAHPKAPTVAVHDPAPNAIISLEGAEHARIRQIVASEFSERKIASLAPYVEQVAERVLDELAGECPPADFVSRVSVPMPLQVICNILGVPWADREIFGPWVSVLFRVEGTTADSRQHSVGLARYMTRLVAQKRREPSDDVIGHLIRSSGREGQEITNGELITLCLSLLMAGYDTTVDQITLCVLMLLLDRPLMKKLTDNPELVGRAVEEFLRLNPAPYMSFARMATEIISVGDFVIEPGQLVVIFIMGANRDPEAFALPNEVMLDRSVPAHLTFGHGVHWCLGAPLARLQLTTLLTALLRRFPDLRIAGDPEALDWKTGMATRRVNQMHVTW